MILYAILGYEGSPRKRLACKGFAQDCYMVQCDRTTGNLIYRLLGLMTDVVCGDTLIS